MTTTTLLATGTNPRHARFPVAVGGYRASFRRMGSTDQDIDELSDRLVDTVAGWGDAERIAGRVGEHREAADHVAISLLGTGERSSSDAASVLASALDLTA